MTHTTRRASLLDGRVWGLALALASARPMLSGAQQPPQATFSSAQQATDALVAAARVGDAARLTALLGPAGKELVSSGDSVQDKHDREQFLRKYDEMHRLAKEPDGTTTLYIGAENWPLPIPLVATGGGWRFDTEAGKQEIVFRRVGRNELAAIRACRALVEAEEAYHAASAREAGGVAHYASKFISDSGTRDGLYWRGEGQRSPIGPLLAAAAGSAGATPFRGYLFRLLTGQGPNAPGGTKSYLVNGTLTLGYAFVAHPAEYRSSGVMTFLVGQDGVVYQKDLGPSTTTLAKALSAYDPDSTWQRAD